MAIWGRITTLIAGIGISRSAGVVIEPILEPERQQAWLKSQAAILEPPELARLVAQGLMSEADAAPYAQRNGYAEDKFKAMVQLELHAGQLASVVEIYNRSGRSAETEKLFRHALAKLQIEEQYHDKIIDLATTRIPADLLAFAHQRGIVPNPEVPELGQLLIPVSAPATTAVDIHGDPSPIRQQEIPLDVMAEFRATGWDGIRAAVNARARGLPPAPGELLQLVNRGTISESEFFAGIGEGDTRNEWRDYLLTLRRRLLTPHEYAEAELRGHLTTAAARDGAALSGLEADDYTLLFAILGRPLALHQVTTGLARGGKYGGDYSDVPAGPYRDSIRRSAIRPEYASLDYANRYVYPSPFVIRTLAEAGDIGDQPAVEQVLLEIGWKPEFAKQVSTAWVGGATADPNVKKSHSKAWTEAQSSYIAEESTAADVAPVFELLGISGTAQTEVLKAWDAIRALTRKQLSPAKIVKAFKSGAINAATGLAWTEADALAALEDRGYNALEAQDLINIG